MSEEMSAVMPEWYDGKKINEVMFCDAFLEEYPMKCIRGQFFTVDGLVDDENMIRMEIYNRIKSFVTSNVAKKATQLMEALKLACYRFQTCFMSDLRYASRFFIAHLGQSWCQWYRLFQYHC